MKKISIFIIHVFLFLAMAAFIACKAENNSSASVAGSTYDSDTLEMKVSIRALDQFSIIETVLDAIRQTNFWDARVINQGPYAAMVAFDDDRGKELERWVVKSKMIVENEIDTNKVMAWIDEGDQMVKATFRITSPPSETNPYGEWTINAVFYDLSDTVTGYFVAACSVDDEGTVNLSLNSEMQEAEGTFIQKGKLLITNDTGKGIIQYTDWGISGPVTKTVSYAYNQDEVIIDEDNDGTGDSLFNRNSYSDIYLDYNVYDSSGENIRNTMSFGIPLKYTDGNNKTSYLYYGGWQGRHQLWGPEGVDVPEGTVLQSGEYGDSSTYTVAKKYMGYLVEKTLIDTSLDDIRGEIIETWMNEGFKLQYSGTQWEKCNGPSGAWDCSTTTGTPYDLTPLVSDQNSRKWVYIWGENAGTELTVAGTSTFTGYTPAASDTVWVNISQPIFISYDGASWIQYNNVTYQDWEPQVNPGDTGAFTFTSDGDFYMHSKGLNYILSVTGNGSVQALKKEIENVIQPGTEAAAFDGVVFTADGQTYTFDWNSADDSITLLDGNSQSYQQSIWYMQKQTGAVANVSYAWYYAENTAETWNIMTYLKDSGDNWIFLDDPIFFSSVTGNDVNGNQVTVNGLAYDGHLFGIPDVWRMLEDNNWVLSNDLKSKIINIPAGDISGKDATPYKIKPVFGIRLLEPAVQSASSPAIDPTLSLDNLPVYDPTDIGAMPVVDTIIIIEGEFINGS